MGGNALKLKGLNPKRIKASELENLSNEISELVINENLFKWIKPVKSYQSKPDHGDLDLIGELNREENHKGLAWHLRAKEILDSKALHWNKPVASLEYKGYQIDLTGRNSLEKAKTHLEFSHYSPLGNILGRIIRKTGAKWGIDGLEYEIKEKNSPEAQHLLTITLTNNIDKILSFCGLNPKIWHDGFESQHDIFNYACQSPLFEKEMFSYENLNHTHRKRDRTRPDYHQWLEFIETQPNNASWSKNESPHDYENRISQWVNRIDSFFPESNLKEKIKEQRHYSQLIKENKREKFNGKLVNSWTGLETQQLGKVISEFKKSRNIASKKEFDKWLLNNNKIAIKRDFLDFFNKNLDSYGSYGSSGYKAPE